MSDFRTQHWIALVCLALALMWQAQGADTEIYTKTDTKNPPVPNVLLLLEASNPMRLQAHDSSRPVTEKDSLLYLATENAKNLIDYYYDNPQIPIRIGLMRYWDDHGRILVPIESLDKNYNSLIDELNELKEAKLAGYGSGRQQKDRENCLAQAQSRGWDPKVCPTGEGERLLAIEGSVSNVGALNEAWLYYQGGNSTGNQNAHGATPKGPYTSPIQYECQKNHVVVFTDGYSHPSAPTGKNPGLPDCQGDNECLIEMTKYMRTTDVSTGNGGQSGEQNVQTHFVRLKPGNLNPDPALAAAAAQGSGGEVIESTQNLFTKDNQQVSFINHIATPFIPSVPQQIGSQIITRSQVISETGEVSYDYHIYYGLFEPSDNKRWLGNLKKYGLQTDSSGSVIGVLDKDGEAAVEDGAFKTDATSYWRIGNEPDGDKATEGGMADRLGSYNLGQHGENDRKVYTWHAQTKSAGPAPLARIVARETQDNKNFRVINQGLFLSDSNEFISLNTEVGRSIHTCAGSDIPRNERVGFALANWLRGVDVCDEDEDGERFDGRPIMGGVQPGKPVVVPFGGTIGDVMLALSNDGYLHILKINDSETPSVVGSNPIDALEWASIFPGTQLIGDDLDQTYRLFQNLQGQPFTLSNGDISIRLMQQNRDGDLLDTSEGVVVYFGQRRGGDDIFSIFLGRPDNFDNKPPLLFWQIQGGATGTAGFKDMGETWSTPKYITLSYAPSAVLFGGGYDSDAFDCSSFMSNNTKNCIDESRPQNSTGNAIYMVNPDTGALIWRAGDPSSGANLKLPDMKYSFAAPLRLVDTNNNGHTDVFFAVDVGGQVWRFDIDNTGFYLNLNTRITGGVIADLHGGEKDELHNRRFYNTPDVAYARDALGNRQLRINIGSGYRAHPLDTGTQDRMYSFVQPLAKPINYTKVKIEELLDITTLDTEAEIAALTPAQRAKLNRGWYLDLNAAAGEKVLSDPFTFRGIVYFSTYTPPEEDTNPCNTPDFGTNRLYVIHVNNGLPVANLSDSNTQSTPSSPDDPLDASNRSIELATNGIAPTPDLVFSADGAQIIAGTEILDDTRAAPIPTRQILYWSPD